MAEGESERLHKVLARAGVASRRAAERLILAGRVRVNGAVVRELGVQVDPLRDLVEVDGQPVLEAGERHEYVLLNKPMGVVSTASDPEGRPTVTDLVGSPRRLYPVGRLDLDSEGLVLLTDDGDLTYRLTQARYEVEKEYHVFGRGWLSPEALDQLEYGVELHDGPARAVQATVLEERPDGSWISVVLHEGRKREVRRMMAAVGFRVEYLVRVRLGPLWLGRLEPGEWRHLRRREVNSLRRAVGLAGGRDEDA